MVAIIPDIAWKEMDLSVNNSTRTPVESGMLQIRERLERQQYAQALEAAESLLREVPENRDVLYMLAVSYRHLNRIPDALATLERLELLHPAFSRLYQERGHCLVALRDAPKAIEAYLRGVNINPALPASWVKLAALYRISGDAENAAKASAHVATLKHLPADVVTATALFSDGELTLAENIIRAYLLKHDNHVEAMRLLARIGIAREVFDDAELLLAAVLALAPGYDAARFDYARALLERHKHPQAVEQLDLLLQRDPTNRQFKTLYATACTGIGEHEKALELYRELLVKSPRATELLLSIGHTLKTLGRYEESIGAYRATAAARPSFGDAYWSLANLKTYRFTDNELERMRTEESSPTTSVPDRYHLCFALGMALENRCEYEESFRYYERGNALKRSEVRYRPDLIERNTCLQKQVCTREFFAARRHVGAADPSPIFIVGLPRAGSTLLEQILASHSRVEGTRELPNIPRIATEFQGRDSDLTNPRYPGLLVEMQPEDLRRLGDKYLSDTRVYRTDKPHFIDKMPNNFRHLGLIRLLLPRAKVIDARREPMACCFSNLKQLFASGQEFTYSVEDIARYYRTYLDLMRHWDEVLPGGILRVHYEDVVEDLEGSVRRMLDFCGLPFEAQCIDFHRTLRSVSTASSEQVRQPIFREGLEQWKNYEAWLGPLKDMLGDALMTYRTPPRQTG
jgi:tetratricopeptide (TPR) repeat protein